MPHYCIYTSHIIIVAVNFPEHDLHEVRTFIPRLPDTSSAADMIPTSQKHIEDLVVLYIIHLFNTSIAAGRLPSSIITLISQDGGVK